MQTVKFLQSLELYKMLIVLMQLAPLVIFEFDKYVDFKTFD